MLLFCLWFLFQVVSAILLLLLAIVLALIINKPVSWLESKRIKRGWASLIVFGVILLILALLAWFIGPKISEQLSALVTNLPDYAENISQTIGSWFSDYPKIQEQTKIDANSIADWLPSMPKTLMHVGSFSLSVVGGVILTIVFMSMVVYAVANPRPLVELYLSVFPPLQRDEAGEALSKT